MSPTKTRPRLLTELPAARVAELPAIRDKWIQLGLTTGPGNRERAWEGIGRAYEIAGRERPTWWFWMRSPLESAVCCAILRRSFDQVRDQVLAQVLAQVRDQVLDQVSAQVRAQVRAQVSDQVLAQVLAQVRDQVRDQVLDQVLDQVRDQVSAQVRAQVRAQVSDQVSDQVRAQVRDQVRAQVRAQVRDQVRDQVSAQVSDQVSDQVRAQVSDQVRDQVRDQVSDQVREFAWLPWWAPGQFDSWWLSFYDALREYCDFSRLEGLIAVAENCAYAWTFPSLVVFCAPPVAIHRDDRGRLHHESLPAVAFADGWGVYAWHGVRVAARIIEHPETITAEEITNQENAERRRVLLTRFGEARYLEAIKAEPIDASDYGTLYRAEFPDDEPLVVVKVINSTVEPDGSFKSYFLRVPPTITRAREAVAWSFDLKEDEYVPGIQS
jgi:flagellar basal body-associated protein FliL